jgi:hypothetical protein
MAWSDMRNQTMGNITNLLSLKQNREQAKQNRRVGLVSDAANTFQANKQADIQRDFTTTEREASQDFESKEARMAEAHEARMAGDENKYQQILMALQQDFRLEEIDASLRADIEKIQAQGDVNSTLQEEAAAQRAELQGIIGKQALEEIDARYKADLELLERQNQMPWDEMGENSWTSPSTGKTYTWSTDQEYELVKSQIESDNYMEAQRLIASLRDDSPDSATRIREAYEFGKTEILLPMMFNEDGSLKDVSEIKPEYLEQRINEALDLFPSLNEEEKIKVLTLLSGFIDASQGGGGGGGGDETEAGKGFRQTWRTALQSVADRWFPVGSPWRDEAMRGFSGLANATIGSTLNPSGSILELGGVEDDEKLTIPGQGNGVLPVFTPPGGGVDIMDATRGFVPTPPPAGDVTGVDFGAQAILDDPNTPAGIESTAEATVWKMLTDLISGGNTDEKLARYRTNLEAGGVAPNLETIKRYIEGLQ